jgi:hypothetical protein
MLLSATRAESGRLFSGYGTRDKAACFSRHTLEWMISTVERITRP